MHEGDSSPRPEALDSRIDRSVQRARPEPPPPASTSVWTGEGVARRGAPRIPLRAADALKSLRGCPAPWPELLGVSTGTSRVTCRPGASGSRPEVGPGLRGAVLDRSAYRPKAAGLTELGSSV